MYAKQYSVLSDLVLLEAARVHCLGANRVGARAGQAAEVKSLAASQPVLASIAVRHLLTHLNNFLLQTADLMQSISEVL